MYLNVMRLLQQPQTPPRSTTQRFFAWLVSGESKPGGSSQGLNRVALQNPWGFSTQTAGRRPAPVARSRDGLDGSGGRRVRAEGRFGGTRFVGQVDQDDIDQWPG